MLMGLADVIPGVSGGTVALLTGIYPRLVKSLASLDRRNLGLLWQRRFREFAVVTDLRFLVALGCGIGTGLVATLLTIVRLMLDDTGRGVVLAAFLGMLLAAALVMFRRMEPAAAGSRLAERGLLLAGLVLALGLSVSQQAQPVEQPSLGFLFLCGWIAISAMILPGISGAMLLVLLGVYAYLVHIPHDLLQGLHLGPHLLTVLVFGLGCLAGLLSMTRLLKWLLERWPRRVTWFLFGLMLGAAPCLWPYQTNSTPTQPKLNLRVYQMRWPDYQQPGDWLLLLVAVAAVALILVLEQTASRRRPETAAVETSVSKS